MRSAQIVVVTLLFVCQFDANCAGDSPLAAATDSAKVDALGDPLPQFAIVRFGSARLRCDLWWVRFLDDKTVVSVPPLGRDNPKISLWDATSGRLLAEHCHEKLAGRVNADICANGKTMVTFHLPETYRVWEVRTGKLVREFKTTEPGNQKRDNGRLLLSADGKRFASSFPDDSFIRVWSTESDDRPVQLEFPKGLDARAIALSPDGRSLAANLWWNGRNWPESSTIRIWDTSSGQMVRKDDAKLGAVYQTYFTQDGKAMLVVGEMGTALRTLDGKDVWRQKKDYRFQHLVCESRDQLVLNSGLKNEGESEIQIVEVTSGQIQRRWKSPLYFAGDWAISPDARLIAASGIDRIWLMTSADGKHVIPKHGHTNAIYNTRVTPDGQILVSNACYDKNAILWGIATGREIKRFNGNGVVFSPNGKFLAWSDDADILHIGEYAGGRQLYQLPDQYGPCGDRCFSSDSATIAIKSDKNHCIYVFDWSTGQLIHQMPIKGVHRDNSLLRHPDGRMLMIAVENNNNEYTSQPVLNGVEVWDVMASRLIRRFDGHPKVIDRCILSPDGRTLATCSEDEGYIRLWEMATGQQRSALNEKTGTGSLCHTHIVFSPDGLTIAAAVGCGVYLWDVASGKQFESFPAHNLNITSVDFTPDARLLLTGSQDTTILGWDMTASARKSRHHAAALSDETLAEHWDRLRDATAAKAYESKWALVGDPHRAVAYMRNRFRVVQPIPLERIRSWLAALDAKKYSDREQAEREIAAHFDQAEVDLRKELASGISAEKSNRINRIIASATTAVPGPDQLRELRAVEILEQIGTTEACDVLRHLATSEVRTRIKRDAAESLKRLDARPR